MRNRIHIITEQLLREIEGDTSSREGLRDTPKRFAAFIKEVTTPPDFTPTVFDSEGYDEMVIQSNIQFYSMCEHHLVPFFGVACVAYIPDKKIIGLSKLARMVELHSKSLQNQERITSQVADTLLSATQPKGVGVTLRARHLCMEMRGVRKPGVETITTAVRGVFKSNPDTRAEYLRFVG